MIFFVKHRWSGLISLKKDLIKMRYLIYIFLFTIIVTQSHAQRTRVGDYRMQQEQLKKTELLRELDSGVYYMETGDYVTADVKFRHVLENIKSVPSDLTFFFGKNSYYIEKYKQSIDWLTKYIQLKGTNGQYSEEASSLLRNAETKYLKEKTSEMQKAGEVLSINYEIDCGPSGKVTCPVCKGDHVVIKKNAFGSEYNTCPYCNEHGLLTCQQYNLLLRGELKKAN
jgi:ssDNA-binding Zn-finger/Zn-ribbon topoisomerase 1